MNNGLKEGLREAFPHLVLSRKSVVGGISPPLSKWQPPNFSSCGRWRDLLHEHRAFVNAQVSLRFLIKPAHFGDAIEVV